ncbi:MAG: energy transducer TonB [Treponema sp.]|jgi:protein TonB|nr:energy transducer TonB [Treponema sp.]
MHSPPSRSAGLIRLILFLTVAGVHGAFILFFVIRVAAAPPRAVEEEAMVMKLTDLAEREEPPEPLPYVPPPPPEIEYTEPVSNTVEAIAETMIETDEEPDQIVVSGIISARPSESGQEEYLPMHRISIPPLFPEDAIKNRLIYPPIALRAKIEGMVYLELFVDRRGEVQRITVLRETPENRGFAEAAVKAFEGIQGVPAQANGAAVAVRYRYPVRFAIRG